MTDATIQAKFAEFHRLNPWVYRTLIALARDLHRRGHARMGIAMLWEVLRWQYMRRTTDPNSTFKLNNNYKSRYVRMIVVDCPDLAEAFHLRALKVP